MTDEYKDNFDVREVYGRPSNGLQEAESLEPAEHMRIMFDSMPFTANLIDKNFKIVDCNQASKLLFGVSSKEEYIAKFVDLSPERQPDGKISAKQMVENMSEAFKRGYLSFEWMHNNMKGELIPCEIILIRMYYLDDDYLIGYARDLREIKANEQKMREITEREREARIKSEVAFAANEAKSQFLSNMSHEIRTPMNSIIGFSELALDEEISPKAREYLTMIVDSTEWLLQIINNILDISKIESGNMELEIIPFDLIDLVDTCKSIISPMALKKNIALHFDTHAISDITLSGDPTRLQQILINLLANAVKFTECGEVSLVLSVEDSVDKNITINFEVSDSGIGMTPEQIERICEPFMQAGVSTTRKHGGTGLGLAITKSFLELMNSDLVIESAVNVGTKVSFSVTFEMIYPVDAIPENGNHSIRGEKPVFKGTVLVCEDNQMNQRVIAEHLARVGLDTEIAENGQEGIDMVKGRVDRGDKPYDLIFMDMNMPVMDGIEATKEIVALGVGTPVVAMTASVTAGDREKYRKRGMNDYLGKPFTTQELWHCLLKYLKPERLSEIEVNSSPIDDEKLLIMLKTDFASRNRDKYDELGQAIKSGDFTLGHRLAHTLKSNAGLIGKPALGKTAADIESLLGSGKVPGKHLMESLKTELVKTLEELQPLLDAASNAAAREPLSEEQTMALLDELEVLLDNINPASIDLLDDLRAVPGSEKLAGFISDYDFESAAVELAAIKASRR